MLRRSPLGVLSLTMTCWIAPVRAFAQDDRPTCPAAEAHRYDFLVGDWRGKEYSSTSESPDSVMEATWTAHNRKLAFDCAYEEHNEITVKGKPFNRIAMLRAFDLNSHQWQYSLVDDFVELAVFQSTMSDSGWVYSHMLPGKTSTLLNTQWVRTSTGYTELMRVSKDGGKTWTVFHHVHYTRVQ
jgi:hypothetical protein